MIKIKQATKCGYIEMKSGGLCDVSYPKSNTRRGRVQKMGDISPTLTASDNAITKIEEVEYEYAIRKLTPRECLRLMDVTETDINKILDTVSDTQAYKQAGNSIVVNVMVEMFKNLNINQG